MHPEYARNLASFAYVWGWPLADMDNRRAALARTPGAGRLAMRDAPVTPHQTAGACPDPDLVHGAGLFSLGETPVVLQVPDFGDRYWVYGLYDGRTEQFGRLGRAYGSRPGFYALIGPNWEGQIPAGITGVFRSPTEMASAVPRAFMNDTDEDRAAIQPILNLISAYPLSEFDGTLKIVDWSRAPTLPGPAPEGEGETKRVDPETFFDRLPDLLDRIPPLLGEEALYAQFRLILAVAERDPQLKAAMVEQAHEAEATTLKRFLEWRHNGHPAGNGWNRSTNNARWGIDYFNRTGTARSNMFDNRPEETQYFYTDLDGDGRPLTGARNYVVTFAAGQEPPVKGFWSLTLYNRHHLFHPNPLARYSLGTRNTSLKRNADGSLTLYVGADSPGPEHESNWLPAPDDGFSLYIRAYWAGAAVLDGSWRPPEVLRIP
ncbi:DUF1254 domain-containing protein [Brevundimonas goettingensis]|uniref:DUF1254 domain-containing protein n=2 Tax=Brevundimonas goettingensis TaxID=2774190 RepID=A0A975C5F6_9CAUL|nr:DUF1254 domain-containing protein [Brevundimonas goettingensis]